MDKLDTQLKFNADGKFKIVQFTDVHYCDSGQKDKKTIKLMNMVLDTEKPDLVVFTGDTVYGDENAKVLPEALSPVINANVPWAVVFGNHDVEWGSPKEDLMSVMQKLPRCLTKAGPANVSGLGNYYLEVHTNGEKNAPWILYLIDSGMYNSNHIIEGYDYIKRDQIEWYARTSKELGEKYGNFPALCFFHTPIPEYNEVWNYEICYGEKNEGVCCPKQNSGMFSAMVEMGDVKGVFVGHDHINDYWGELYGIKLFYGRGTGYNTYIKRGFAHGARIIELNEKDQNFVTWMVLDNGEVIKDQPKHKPRFKRD